MKHLRLNEEEKTLKMDRVYSDLCSKSKCSELGTLDLTGTELA